MSMKFRIQFVVLGLLSLLSGCVQDVSTPNSPIEYVSNNPFRISEEEALSSLKGVAEDLYSSGLRSSQEKLLEINSLVPSRLSPIRLSQAQLREGNFPEKINIDTMLYIVNFSKKRGFAILAADKRIGAPILAVVDSGSISRANFENHSIILMSEDERRKEIPDFRAYSPQLNDYSVGAMLEDPHANLIGDMTRNFLNKTISKEITSASRKEDLDDSFKNGDIYHDKDGKDSYFFWVKIKEVRALLETKWHQWHPFNAWCPERRKTLGFLGPKQKAPAGCVGIAVAQVFAFHERPKQIEYYGNVVDWKMVKRVCPYYRTGTLSKPENVVSEDDKRLRDNAAALAMAVGDGVKTSWGYSGSAAFPCNAASYMRKSGYSMATRRWGLNKEMILEMLDNHRPVILCAAAGLSGGHAWVVDGYMQYRLEIEKRTDKGVVVEKTNERRELIHCNFGWGGLCDGYYTPSIFDTGSSPEARDDKDTNHDKDKDPSVYNWLFSIITY